MARAQSTSKSRQALQKRTKLEWVLLAALLLIAYLFLASRYSWWPSNDRTDNLGTAFYIVKRVPPTLSNAGATTTSTGGVSVPGNSGSGSQNGGGGSTASTSRILVFSAGVDSGNSKQETSGAAGGLNENCAIVANASSLGKQEVCTYTEGDKIVTITYLNDQVISASRSGF
jgi:hypothetical protein